MQQRHPSIRCRTLLLLTVATVLSLLVSSGQPFSLKLSPSCGVVAEPETPGRKAPATYSPAGTGGGVVVRSRSECPREPLCVDAATRHMCSHVLARAGKFVTRLGGLLDSGGGGGDALTYVPPRGREEEGGGAEGRQRGGSFYHATRRLRHTSRDEVDYTDGATVAVLLENVHNMLESTLVGQEHVLLPLARRVKEKILHPEGRPDGGGGGAGVGRDGRRGPGDVLHFAGDNGVGKTLTATLIGRVLSKYCRPAYATPPPPTGWRGRLAALGLAAAAGDTGYDGRCADAGGDALLVIQGTSLRSNQLLSQRRRREAAGDGAAEDGDDTATDGDVAALWDTDAEGAGKGRGGGAGSAGAAAAALREAVLEDRARIVALVTAHVRRFPHGVILLDDFSEMAPELVALLHPLLGRADYFPEQEALAAAGQLAPLSYSTVIIATDMGREGRTRHKTVAEVERMVRREVRELYGSRPLITHTFVFQALTPADARRIAADYVSRLPCRLNRPNSRAYNEVDGGRLHHLPRAAAGDTAAAAAAATVYTPRVRRAVASEAFLWHVTRAWQRDGEGRGNGHDLMKLLSGVVEAALDAHRLAVLSHAATAAAAAAAATGGTAPRYTLGWAAWRWWDLLLAWDEERAAATVRVRERRRSAWSSLHGGGGDGEDEDDDDDCEAPGGSDGALRADGGGDESEYVDLAAFDEALAGSSGSDAADDPNEDL